MSATSTAGRGDLALTVLMTVNNQDRSRDFYRHVIGAGPAREGVEAEGLVALLW